MKRLLAISAICVALAAPAAAQWRLDIGVDIPKGIGASFEGSISMSSDAQDFLSKAFIPFPEAAIYYQAGLGPVTLGVGARAFTVILASVAWPNVIAEISLDPVVIEAQIGGGLFGWFAVTTGGLQSGKVFFPDLSAWVKLGKKKNLRLGAGALGVLLPDQTSGMGFAFYLGGKVAIPL